MEPEKILRFVNERPEYFLNFYQQGKQRRVIEGIECTIMKNNMTGGIEIFYPNCVVSMVWDKTNRKWQISSPYGVG